MFQSSFELTVYITAWADGRHPEITDVSKLFRAYGLYNKQMQMSKTRKCVKSFKALSSLQVI